MHFLPFYGARGGGSGGGGGGVSSDGGSGGRGVSSTAMHRRVVLVPVTLARAQVATQIAVEALFQLRCDDDSCISHVNDLGDHSLPVTTAVVVAAAATVALAVARLTYVCTALDCFCLTAQLYRRAAM